jgi:hypothetical protein
MTDIGINMDELPEMDELPDSGEGSRSDFMKNPEGLQSPEAVVETLKDDGIDPFDLDDRGQVEYAEGALRGPQLSNVEDRSRTEAQVEAEHDLVAAYGRTEFGDEFTFMDFPSPEDP